MSSKKVRNCPSSDEEGEDVTKRAKNKEGAGKKQSPNILVSGTPGVGKSTLCQKIKEKYQGGPLEVVNIGQFAKDHGYLGQYDAERECPEIDEDAVIDNLEPRMSGGESVMVIDYHATDFFPERWFDAVFVLRTNNTLLYDRLNARGYSQKKVEENLQCEIFQTILDEARESYREEIVHELTSESEQDIESNADRIVQWMQNWKSDN